MVNMRAVVDGGAGLFDTQGHVRLAADSGGSSRARYPEVERVMGPVVGEDAELLPHERLKLGSAHRHAVLLASPLITQWCPSSREGSGACPGVSVIVHCALSREGTVMIIECGCGARAWPAGLEPCLQRPEERLAHLRMSTRGSGLEGTGQLSGQGQWPGSGSGVRVEVRVRFKICKQGARRR